MRGLSIKIFAALSVFVAFASAQTPNTAWYTANPSAAAFSISTADQLAGLAQLVNAGNGFGGKTVMLTRDVDLSAYGAGYNGGKGWTPIGDNSDITQDRPFSGVFDGRGYTVTNLYVNNIARDFAGLFGNVGGTVRNLGVAGSVSGKAGVGIVAGRLAAGAAVVNCYSSGSAAGGLSVGGIAGTVGAGGRVEHCHSSSAVSGVSRGGVEVGDNIGGVVGYLSVHNTIKTVVKNCYATGAVKGANAVGGIVGSTGGSNDIINCAALSPSVAASAGSDVGRVLGKKGVAVALLGNVAYSGMACASVSVTGERTVNGQDITKNAISADGKINGLFADAGVWTTAPHRLPGLFGGTVDMAVHAPHLVVSAYVVKYDLNGGTGSIQNAQVPPGGTAAAAPSVVGITRTGHNIAGAAGEWYLDAACTNVNRFIFGAGGTAVNDDITLYLKWTLDTFYDPNISGAGTNADPYRITTVKQLSYVGLMVNEGNPAFNSAFYRLENDISLAGIDWTPIGTENAPFAGVFDGNRKEISNLTIYNGENHHHVGLFGYVGGGGIIRLGLVDVNINVSAGDVGAVAGTIVGGSIRFCYSDGSISGGGNVGGVVGVAQGSDIDNCYSAANVISQSPDPTLTVGGVIGVTVGGLIKDCAALNPKVSGMGSGRVIGGIGAGIITVMENNAAFDSLLNKYDNTNWGPIDNPGHINGIDISSLDIHTTGTIGGRFTPARGGWSAAPGKLPGFGNPEDMPAHILLRTVSYGAANFGGTVGAVIGGVRIHSGGWAEKGKEIVFTATPISGYKVGEWTVTVGGAAVTDHQTINGVFEGDDDYGGSITYTVSSSLLYGNIDVRVSFEAVATEFAEIVFSNPYQTYTGSPADTGGISVKQKDGGTPLERTLTLLRNGVETDDITSAGEVTVIAEITQDPHAGVEVMGAFTIAPKNITGGMIDAIDPLTYNGEALTPEITVRDAARDEYLVDGGDYEIAAYTNNINAGIAQVSIVGKGNYTGTANSTFAINKSQVTVTAGQYAVTKLYDGTTAAGTGDASLLSVAGIIGTGVDVIAVPNSFPGSNVKNDYGVSVTISLSNTDNHILASSSNLNVPGSITPLDISGAEVVIDVAYEFNGFARNPSQSNISVRLGNSQTPIGAGGCYDYNKIRADGNRDAGTAVVTIIGEGNCQDTAVGTFKITPKSVALTHGNYFISKPYDGTDTAAAASGSLGLTGALPGTDVSVTAVPGIYPSADVGNYQVDVEAVLTGADAENYRLSSNQLTLYADIYHRNISNAMVEVDGTYIYTGTPQTPAAKVSIVGLAAPLVINKDYNLEVISGGTNAGPAEVRAIGIGNFTGQVTGNFSIDKKAPSVDDLSYTVPIAHTYTGAPQGIGAVTHKSGIVGFGSIAVHYNGSTALPVEVGNYTVTANIAAGLNYEAAVLTLGQYTIGTVSILGSDRVVPDITDDDGATVIPPITAIPPRFTAGPNPISRSNGRISFYYNGKRADNGSLAIYDAIGNVIRRVNIIDGWNLRDASGRIVPSGSYLIRGTIIINGKREKISLIIGVL